MSFSVQPPIDNTSQDYIKYPLTPGFIAGGAVGTTFGLGYGTFKKNPIENDTFIKKAAFRTKSIAKYGVIGLLAGSILGLLTLKLFNK